jgi:hypothetical protein
MRFEGSDDDTLKRQIASIVKASESMHQMREQFSRFTQNLLTDTEEKDMGQI